MALLAVETTCTSDVIKHIYDPSTGYTNELVDVTIPAGGMKMGSVLDNAGALVTVAGTANAAYVVVDPDIQNKSAGSAKVIALARGPVIVDKSQLVYATDVNDNTKKNAVLAVLKAKGILAE